MTAPLLPADVDLRDFQYMPLDVVRLRDSSMVVKRTSDEIVAGILLWCASWHQVPASSLPNDDAELAGLAGFGRGRGIKDFKKVREGATHNLILCDDGRFYHPVVAEKAAESWNSKLAEAWRRACDNTRKHNKEREAQGLPILPNPERPRLLIQQNQGDIPTWVYGNSGGIPHAIPSEATRKARRKGTEGKGTEGKGTIGGVASQPLPGVPPGDAGRQPLNGKASEARTLLGFLNDKAGKRFPESDSNVGIIVARMREGFTPAQIRQVIAFKVREWNGDEEMRKFLRPDTLFNRSKFSNYVGEIGTVTPDSQPEGASQ